MLYDHETYRALIESGQIRTWADGYGRWHAEVSANAAGPMLAARGAIWFELRERETKTDGTLPAMPTIERVAEVEGRIEYREKDPDTIAFGGYANQPTLDFEQFTANTRPVFDALSAFAAECLRRVPGMTPQTLGRNIKDNARIVVDQAMKGEPLRFLGWGDRITIEPSSARHWVELGTIVGLANWHQIHETDTGDSWLETAQGILDESGD